MKPLLNIAVRAARAAGDVLVRHFDHREQLNVEQKGINDYVSEADRKAEQEILFHIRRAYPEHAILAEESGVNGEHEVVWIIDPLDGTTNFLRGLAHFAVSIAVQVRGQIDHAVVYNPITQDLYTASRGEGAWLNNRRIRVSQRKQLDHALLGTGFPFRPEQEAGLEAYLALLRYFAPRTAGIRRPGAAALDLAAVASGTYDGFWESHLQPSRDTCGSVPASAP